MTGTIALRSIRSPLMTGWRSEAEMLKALDRAKASLAHEGMTLRPDEEQLVLRRARGEITQEEFTRLVVELARQPDPSRA
jgi:hypothetical protein